MCQFEYNKTAVFAAIKNSIPDAVIEVDDMTGDGNHLHVTVKSASFKGQSMLGQHRLVMDSLKEEFSSQLHAIKLKTKIL